MPISGVLFLGPKSSMRMNRQSVVGVFFKPMMSLTGKVASVGSITPWV